MNWNSEWIWMNEKNSFLYGSFANEKIEFERREKSKNSDHLFHQQQKNVAPALEQRIFCIICSSAGAIL